jgi:hypothetical protein
VASWSHNGRAQRPGGPPLAGGLAGKTTEGGNQAIAILFHQ